VQHPAGHGANILRKLKFSNWKKSFQNILDFKYPIFSSNIFWEHFKPSCRFPSVLSLPQTRSL
jgi:hypothetical protein